MPVWDTAMGTCVAVLKGHTDKVTCLAVVGGGSKYVGARVVSGPEDKTVQVWDVDTGTCKVTLQGHTKEVSCLAVVGGSNSGVGARVVLGSWDKTVRVWDAAMGTCVAVKTKQCRFGTRTRARAGPPCRVSQKRCRIWRWWVAAKTALVRGWSRGRENRRCAYETWRRAPAWPP